MDHIAVILPGLGQSEGFPFLTNHWRKKGIESIIYRLDWKDGEHFDTKLTKLLAVIDSYTRAGKKVSLIGCSAGASAAMNAFVERKSTIHKIVTLCGWVHTGNRKAYLEKWRRISPALVESALHFDQNESNLSDNDRSKILCAHSVFDELVPSDASTIHGVREMSLPPEHNFAIFAGLTYLSGSLIEFIKS